MRTGGRENWAALTCSRTPSQSRWSPEAGPPLFWIVGQWDYPGFSTLNGPGRTEDQEAHSEEGPGLLGSIPRIVAPALSTLACALESDTDGLGLCLSMFCVDVCETGGSSLPNTSVPIPSKCLALWHHPGLACGNWPFPLARSPWVDILRILYSITSSFCFFFFFNFLMTTWSLVCSLF